MKIEHKIVVKRAKWADNHPQGEIKVQNDAGQSQCLIIVAKDGWNYRDQERDARNPTTRSYHTYWGKSPQTSAGMQVRISMNGPLMLTMSEWEQINQYIDKVYQEVLDEHTIRGI